MLGASVGEEIASLITRGKAREVGTISTLPPGVPEVSIAEAKRIFDPLLKKWWVWAIAGTAVVGTVVFVVRRRKRARRGK